MPKRRPKQRGMYRPPRLEPLEARVLLVGEFTDQGPPGVTSYWSVQAVDTSVAGSAFAAEQSLTVPQFTDIGSLGIAGVYVSRVAWGDYDSDGDLDAVIQGFDGASDITRIYQNNGNGAFTDINAGLLGLGNGAVAWGDYDNDGKLDLIIAGQTSSTVSHTKLYHNDGHNTFTENTAAVFPGVKRSSVVWGDYDNDGDLDLLISGNTNNGYVTSVHRNEGDSTFTDINAGLTQVAYGSVAWGDYDSDGRIDIIATGRTTSDHNSTTIYQNDGGGVFTDINAGLSSTPIRNVAWGDYDNDGDLDLVTSGFSVVTTGDFQSGFIHTVVGSTTVRRNDGNNTFTDLALGFPGTSYGSVAWGDYDNDGRLDLLVVGNIYGGETAKVYRNNCNDMFTDANAGLTIPYLGSGAWGDFDGDNDLDILIIGRDGSPFADVYRNDETTANTAPDTPTGLTVTTVSPTTSTIAINRDAQAGRYIQNGSNSTQIVFTDTRATATNGAAATLGGQISINLVNTASNLAASTVAGVAIDSSGNYTVTINLRDDGTNSTATLADIQAAIAAHVGAARLISASATATGGYGAASAPAVFGSSNGPRQLTGGQGTADNDLTFTDVRAIADRDDYSVAITFIAAAANQSLGISVDTDTFGNKTISFTLATDAAGRVTTTAAQLKAFLDNDASVGTLTARTLVSATASGNGSGTLAAASTQSLPIVNNSGSSMTLSWAAATDTETAATGLSYNLRVGTTPGGSDVFSTMANSTSGLRTVTTAGPIQGTSFTIMNLTPGTTYYWSVQAIDSAFAGGAFAGEQSFYVFAEPVVASQDFLIGENSLNGAFIGTMAATDMDAGQTKTWSITAGNTNNAFAINPTTGVLTVNNSAALNYEIGSQISLIITATDNGSPALSGSTVTTVFLRNENEAPAVTSKQFLIGENSINNAYIGVVPVSDQDSGQTRTYSIVAGNTNDAFSINPTTGVLSVNNTLALDYETVTRFDLVVRVVDNGIPAAAGTATVTVFLRDTNDAPVVNSSQFLIGENSVNNAFIGTIVASDQDAGQTKTYSIVVGNVGNAFAINSTTGVLTVNNTLALDYETMQRFDLVVRVVDHGIPAAAGAATVTVFLRDENDAPIVTPQNFLISENSLNGAFIGTMAARDQDVGQTKSFAITGGNENNAFAINPSTGVLSVNNSAALNYESNTQINLTVTVTDNGNPAQTGSAPVIVFLRDINEAPVVTPTQFLIGEHSVNGAYIGVIPAADQDAGQTVSYSIVGGNTNNAFSIDASTGVLHVNNSVALDYQTTPQFNLTVRVTDNGNPSRSGDAAVTVFLRTAPNARPSTILETDKTTVILPTVRRSPAISSTRLVKAAMTKSAG